MSRFEVFPSDDRITNTLVRGLKAGDRRFIKRWSHLILAMSLGKATYLNSGTDLKESYDKFLDKGT
jgi:hypothetical protein